MIMGGDDGNWLAVRMVQDFLSRVRDSECGIRSYSSVAPHGGWQTNSDHDRFV